MTRRYLTRLPNVHNEVVNNEIITSRPRRRYARENVRFVGEILARGVRDSVAAQLTFRNVFACV